VQTPICGVIPFDSPTDCISVPLFISGVQKVWIVRGHYRAPRAIAISITLGRSFWSGRYFRPQVLHPGPAPLTRPFLLRRGFSPSNLPPMSRVIKSNFPFSAGCCDARAFSFESLMMELRTRIFLKKIPATKFPGLSFLPFSQSIRLFIALPYRLLRLLLTYCLAGEILGYSSPLH